MMFSFYDQLIIYLCETRDRVRLIARLVTRSRGLARLDTVWYQQTKTEIFPVSTSRQMMELLRSVNQPSFRILFPFLQKHPIHYSRTPRTLTCSWATTSTSSTINLSRSPIVRRPISPHQSMANHEWSESKGVRDVRIRIRHLTPATLYCTSLST